MIGLYSETRLHPCLAVRYTGMEWNGGSFKGVPVLPPPVACGKPVEAGTELVYAVHYCNRREGKPSQYGDCFSVGVCV